MAPVGCQLDKNWFRENGARGLSSWKKGNITENKEVGLPIFEFYREHPKGVKIVI